MNAAALLRELLAGPYRVELICMVGALAGLLALLVAALVEYVRDKRKAETGELLRRGRQELDRERYFEHRMPEDLQ